MTPLPYLALQALHDCPLACLHACRLIYLVCAYILPQQCPCLCYLTLLPCCAQCPKLTGLFEKDNGTLIDLSFCMHNCLLHCCLVLFVYLYAVLPFAFCLWADRFWACVFCLQTKWVFPSWQLAGRQAWDSYSFWHFFGWGGFGWMVSILISGSSFWDTPALFPSSPSPSLYLYLPPTLSLSQTFWFLRFWFLWQFLGRALKTKRKERLGVFGSYFFYHTCHSSPPSICHAIYADPAHAVYILYIYTCLSAVCAALLPSFSTYHP